MFEEIERLKERELQRLPESIFDAASIRTLNDIKRIVTDLKSQPLEDPCSLTTQLLNKDEDGVTSLISASTTVTHKSRYAMLKEALASIKARTAVASIPKIKIPVNGRYMHPANLIDEGTTGWIDKMIRHWLGGYRVVDQICWDIGDGYEYRYDICSDSFGRVPKRRT